MAQKINSAQQGSSTQAVHQSAVETTFSTAQSALLTVTLTNAPAGDYMIDAKVVIRPEGGGNATIQLTTSGTTGTLTQANAGVHSGADADYNTAKYAHRTILGKLVNHPGGTFTVNLAVAVESAVTFRVGLSGDNRWGRMLRVVKVS